jgi:hypothetical protein
MACECDFDIPGVDRLPPHDHNQAQLFNDMVLLNPDRLERIVDIAQQWPLRDAVHIWVDWKAVAANARPRPAG